MVLQECFNAPYGVKFFNQYAESIPDGTTSQFLSQTAKENKIYLIGGRLYNIIFYPLQKTMKK